MDTNSKDKQVLFDAEFLIAGRDNIVPLVLVDHNERCWLGIFFLRFVFAISIVQWSCKFILKIYGYFLFIMFCFYKYVYLRDIFNIIHLINSWGSTYKYLSFPSTSTRHVNFLVKIRMVYNLLYTCLTRLNFFPLLTLTRNILLT